MLNVRLLNALSYANGCVRIFLRVRKRGEPSLTKNFGKLESCCTSFECKCQKMRRGIGECVSVGFGRIPFPPPPGHVVDLLPEGGREVPELLLDVHRPLEGVRHVDRREAERHSGGQAPAGQAVSQLLKCLDEGCRLASF